jgi:hypothetical protein
MVAVKKNIRTNLDIEPLFFCTKSFRFYKTKKISFFLHQKPLNTQKKQQNGAGINTSFKRLFFSKII